MERDASNPPTYSRGEERGELGRCYSVAHGFHTRTKRTGRQLVSYVLIEARFDVLCLEPIFQRWAVTVGTRRFFKTQRDVNTGEEEFRNKDATFGHREAARHVPTAVAAMFAPPHTSRLFPFPSPIFDSIKKKGRVLSILFCGELEESVFERKIYSIV